MLGWAGLPPNVAHPAEEPTTNGRPGGRLCHNRPMRFFNTAGPVRAEDHYAIPPLKRGNVAEILQLIRDKQYFVLHAPRQTGKHRR